MTAAGSVDDLKHKENKEAEKSLKKKNVSSTQLQFQVICCLWIHNALFFSPKFDFCLRIHIQI